MNPSPSQPILPFPSRTRLIELLSEFTAMLRDEAARNKADKFFSSVYLNDASLIESLSQIIAAGTLSQLSPSGSLPVYQNILFSPDSPSQKQVKDPIEIQEY